MSNPLLRHGIHTAARLVYNNPQSLFGTRHYECITTITAPVGQEGLCSTRPLCACIISWLSSHATRRLMLVTLLSRESNPDHEGMNLVCYLCTTQLCNQSASFCFTKELFEAVKRNLAVRALLIFYKYYSTILLKSQKLFYIFFKERKGSFDCSCRFTNLYNGRSGGIRTPEFMVPNHAPQTQLGHTPKRAQR